MNIFLRFFLSFCLLLQGPFAFAGTQDFLDNLPNNIPRPTGPGDTVNVEVDSYTFNGRTIHTRRIVSCKAGEKRTCYHHEEQLVEPSPVVVHSELSVPSDDGSYELRTYTTRFENQKNPLHVEATKRDTTKELDLIQGSREVAIPVNDVGTWETFGPSIAIGIIGIHEHYQDYKNSVERSKKLYETHQNNLKNFHQAQQNANAHLAAGLQATKSNLILASAGFPEQQDWDEIQKQVAEKMRQQEIARRIQNDPLAHKDYQLTPKAQKENISHIESAITNAEYSQLPQLFEELYYQKSDATSESNQLMSKYLSKEGILNNKAITGEEGLLDNASYQTSTRDPHGQVLRRMANQIQAEYAGTNGLNYSSNEQKSMLGSTSLLLNLADANYASGNTAKGDDYLKAAHSMFQGATGFAEGVSEGLTSIVTDLPETAEALGKLGEYVYENPEQAFDKTTELLSNLPEITSAAALAMEKYYEEFKAASPEEKGKILGRLSADFIASYATLGATKVIHATRTGVKLAQMGSKARGLLKFSGNSNSPIKLGQSAMGALDSLPAANRKNFSLSSNRIDDSLDYIRNRESLRFAPETSHQSGNINYLDNLHSANSDYKNVHSYDKLSEEYQNLYDRMDTLQAHSFSGEVQRVIPEVVTTPTGNVTNTVDNAFDFHGGVKGANGRYSMPGDDAIYASVGDKPHHAWDTALEEVDHYAPGELNTENIIIGSRQYKMDRVLDLTKQETRDLLGIRSRQILLTDGPNKYKLTHQLGNIAKNKGYQAILAPAARSNGINIIILKGN